MLKQVTVTDLQRRAAEVIAETADGPVVVSQRGRPAAVIITTETYQLMEQALEEIETRNVQEIVQAGLRSVKEKRVSSHTDVVNRIHARRGKSK